MPDTESSGKLFEPMFVPPRRNATVLRLANVFLPGILNLSNIRDVSVPDADFQHLEALRASRALLSPNHPTGNDPLVVFWLSRMLGQPFNYLCAREVLHGFRGWVMNHVGTYSVIRGVPDRESLRATRRLLADLDRKVVIFPEGEIYEHNDRLLAFQSGVAQIGFWTLDDLQKQGKAPVLPLLPLAIKYRCADWPRAAIENSLRDLERALDLETAPNLTSYQRLRRIGSRVLTSLERDSGLKPDEGGDLPERIVTVREKTLARVAQAIGSELDQRQPPADQLHLLFHDLKRWVGLLPDEHSDYDERLYQHRLGIATPLFGELQRLQNFIAVTGDYVATDPTAERFLEILGRLEVEVFGRVRNRVPREALVRIAAPIRLEDRYDEYRRAKRETVSGVTRELETTIREMLQALSKEASTPISLEA